MDQSEGSPSMRGILSAGNWKTLYSTPGRASAKAQTQCAKNNKIAVTSAGTHLMTARRFRSILFIVFTCLQKQSNGRTAVLQKRSEQLSWRFTHNCGCLPIGQRKI